jgi:hypothetical protein
MEVHLMTDMMSGVENVEDSKLETGLDGLDEQLVAQLVSRAKAGGLALTGEGGVLAQLTNGCWSPRWRARSPTTSAMRNRTGPGWGGGSRRAACCSQRVGRCQPAS